MTPPIEETEFAGAKLALFLGGRLLVIRRDASPGIPWPDHLDLPGGGREGGESPVRCVLRETREEVGLTLDPDDLVWRRSYMRPHGRVWFFVAHQAAERAEEIVFGGEGRGWLLMEPEDFVAREDAVPHFREQLAIYLESGATAR